MFPDRPCGTELPLPCGMLTSGLSDKEMTVYILETAEALCLFVTAAWPYNEQPTIWE